MQLQKEKNTTGRQTHSVGPWDPLLYKPMVSHILIQFDTAHRKSIRKLYTVVDPQCTKTPH